MPQGYCKLCMADRFFRLLPKAKEEDDDKYECTMCKDRIYDLIPPRTNRGDPPKKKKKSKY